MAKKRKISQTSTPPLKFDQKLVLNQWILSLFEVKNFEQLTIGMKEREQSGSGPPQGEGG
ncbi:MAG: hypothetical protein AAB089_03635 [Nitrospirota bacterium]